MQNFSQQSSSDDTIDLFELFGVIWQRKWLIIVITVVGILLAGIYAFSAKEQWTSKAQVRVPEPRQLTHYLNTEESYYRYAMLDKEDTLDTQKKLEDAFTIFSTSLFAIDTKLNAIRNSTYYKTLAEEIDNDTNRLNLLNDLASKNFVSSEAIANNRFIYNVQFAADNRADAHKTLVESISLINNQALETLFDRQENRIKNRILTLETRSKQIKDKAEQERQNKILELEQALQSARAADISGYTGDSPVIGNSIIDLKDSEMLFMLGENYLQAQLSTLSNSSVIYPANYYEILRNTENLHTLLDSEVEGQMFIYTQTPELPLKKDKPRKSLILVVGALFGGVIGVFYVLLQNAITNRRLSEQAQ